MAYRLTVNTDAGIEYVEIIKSYDATYGNHGEDMSNGGWLYSRNDCIQITRIKVKPGYTIETHRFDALIRVKYKLSNLTNADSDYDTWCLASENDASISFTTKASGLVYIDNGTKLEAHHVFIDNGSEWEHYIPYIDNGSGWDACD